HSASYQPWTYAIQQMPGLWVVANGEDGRPDMLEYKNYLITRIPPKADGKDRGWRAYYNDYSDYPFIRDANIEDQFKEPTLDAIYKRLVKMYEKLEPIRSKDDFDSWMSVYRGNKARHETDAEGTNSPYRIIRKQRTAPYTNSTTPTAGAPTAPGSGAGAPGSGGVYNNN
ncbi:MAG: hypothetical protein ACRDV0_10785, partial [Acidimicrobiales bacterium]